MKKKRILPISLGVILSSLPISTIVACSSELSDEESKILRKLTSKEGLNYLEMLWFKKVIDNEGYKINHQEAWKDEMVKKLIKFHIANELLSDSNFLNKLGLDILKITDDKGNAIYNTNSGDKNDILLIGFMRQFLFGYDQEFLNQTYLEGDSQTRIERISEILMTEMSLGFANKIYKYILSSSYQKMNRKQFEEMYEKQNKEKKQKEYIFKSIEKEIDEGQNFLLTKNMVNKQLFFKWEIKLSKEKSNYYIDEPIDGNLLPTFQKAFEQFIYDPNKSADSPKNIIDDGTYELQNRKLPSEVWDLQKFKVDLLRDDKKENEEEPKEEIVEVNLNKIAAFKGISKQENGRGKLGFYTSTFKRAKASHYWYGFLNDNDIVFKNIPTLNKDGVVEINQILGIMPTWDDKKISLKGSIFENDSERVAWLLYQNDSSIYDDAYKYYSTKEEDGGKNIKIEVHNDYLRDKLLEKGLKYIKEKE